jgi:hypothetical protein
MPLARGLGLFFLQPGSDLSLGVLHQVENIADIRDRLETRRAKRAHARPAAPDHISYGPGGPNRISPLPSRGSRSVISGSVRRLSVRTFLPNASVTRRTRSFVTA